MDKDKKMDKTLVYYILGGAALGAIAGYIVKRVGLKNVVDVLKTKKIIPENLMETISELGYIYEIDEFENELREDEGLPPAPAPDVEEIETILRRTGFLAKVEKSKR